MNKRTSNQVAVKVVSSLLLLICVPRCFAMSVGCRVDIIESYPNGTWLENLAQDRQGRLYFSVTSERKIESYQPGVGVRHFADLPIYPMGVAVMSDRLVVSGNRRPMSHGAATLQSNAIVEISMTGSVGRVIDVPDAKMLNGVVVTPRATVLIADSRAGKIWQYAPDSSVVSVWLADELLAPPPNSPSTTVGANGLKLWHGSLLVSNSGRGEILTVQMSSSGMAAGRPYPGIKTGLVDDFDVADDGSIVAAPYSTKIFAFSRTGKATTVVPEGADGATAVSIIRNHRLLTSFYVLTTGGLLLGGGGPALLLRAQAPLRSGCGHESNLE